MNYKWIFTIGIVIIVCLFIFSYVHSRYWKIELDSHPELVNAITPSNLYRQREGKDEQYTSKVVEGFEFMKNKKVVICGLLRDVSRSKNTVQSIKQRVEEVGSLFEEYKVVIVENDSSDNTREELINWADVNPNVFILGCGVNTREKCKLNLPKTDSHNVDEKRMRKMVKLRNMYLDYIKQNFSGYDYVVMWDLDILGRVYLDGIANSFGYIRQDPTIQTMCANGVYRAPMGLSIYYDSFAHQEYNEPKDRTVIGRALNSVRSQLRGLKTKLGDPPRQVDSCFAGFAIYSLSSLISSNVEYSYVEDECEHVTLHKGLTRVFTNPSMIFLVLVNK